MVVVCLVWLSVRYGQDRATQDKTRQGKGRGRAGQGIVLIISANGNKQVFTLSVMIETTLMMNTSCLVVKMQVREGGGRTGGGVGCGGGGGGGLTCRAAGVNGQM